MFPMCCKVYHQRRGWRWGDGGPLCSWDGFSPSVTAALCLFKSLCLSHAGPNYTQPLKSNQKNPQGLCSRTGECPFSFSLRDGYRLSPIKAFVRLPPLQSSQWERGSKMWNRGKCCLCVNHTGELLILVTNKVKHMTRILKWSHELRAFVLSQWSKNFKRKMLCGCLAALAWSGAIKIRIQMTLCIIECVSTYTGLTGAHLLGYSIQYPANSGFKVTANSVRKAHREDLKNKLSW